MPRGRKKGEPREVAEPIWITGFLEALGATGNVSASAEIAGIDVTGVYRRKTRNPEFRDQWEAVVAAREARAGGLTAPPAAMELEPRTSGKGVMLARKGKRRWSAKAEAQFLAAIANGADVVHAAEATGFCKATVMRKRDEDPRFAAVWIKAMEAGQAVVRAGLIAQAAREADEARGAEAAGRMTVAERMAVAKMPLGNGSAGAGSAGAGAGGPYAWSVAGSAQAMAAMRKGTREAEEEKIRIMEKLWRTRKAMMRKRLEQGGLQVGRLVLEPGWVWQGEGPMPALPGQDDDQGWDTLGASIEAWRKAWDRGEEAPFKA